MDEIYALCRTFGPLLSMPEGSEIDGPRFMAAIAWNESSCGQNVTPRYESAYDTHGLYGKRLPQSELLARWGKAAAYSYGAWQILPCNAIGFTPTELQTDNEKCALAFVGFFNRYIIGHMHASTFDEMCQCYNAGHWSNPPLPGVARYVEDAFVHYSDPRVIAALEAA